MRRNLLSGKRIGVVGEPSEWLISSGVDRESARLRWGVEFIDVPLDEVVAEFEQIADDAPATGSTLSLSNVSASSPASVRPAAWHCRC